MKRVKSAAQVQEICFELADGTEWIFALDMQAMAILEEESTEAMGRFRELLMNFSQKPITAATELLYFGLRARQPEITLDEVRQRLPATLDVLNALLSAVDAAMPEMGIDGADPTTPPPGRRTTDPAGLM